MGHDLKQVIVFFCLFVFLPKKIVFTETRKKISTNNNQPITIKKEQGRAIRLKLSFVVTSGSTVEPSYNSHFEQGKVAVVELCPLWGGKDV